VTAATAKIVAGLLSFFAGRRQDDSLFLAMMLRQDYPQRTATQIDGLVASELGRQAEFERRAEERMKRDLPKALAETDPEKRRDAVNRLLEREKRYVEMRQAAMVERASARAEHLDVKLASPEGAYWKLDPTVKKHTLDCVLMGEKFWPWEVLDRIHPLLHTGCQCHLYTKREALERGWLFANHVVDVGDAVKTARAYMERAHRVKEAYPGEIEAWIEERLEEAARGPATEQACHYFREGCTERATKSLIWADGRAYIPVCDTHEKTARAKVAEQHDEVNRVVLVEAAAVMGAMVALYPTGEAAAALAIKGGEPAEDLHITLKFLGKDATEIKGRDKIEAALAAWAKTAKPLAGKVVGMGEFKANPEWHPDEKPIFAKPDIPGIQEFRKSLVAALPAGVMEDTHPEYKPHITLDYIPADAKRPADKLDQVSLVFDRVYLVWSGERVAFMLGTGKRIEESVADEIAALVKSLKHPCDCGADNLPHEYGSACPADGPVPVEALLGEAAFEERLHPRGRGGKWMDKPHLAAHVVAQVEDAEQSLGVERLSWKEIRAQEGDWRVGGTLVTRSGKKLGPDDEVLLFHGTRDENVEAVLRDGFKVGAKQQRAATRVSTEEEARLLGKRVGDALDYEPGRGVGGGTYLAPMPDDTRTFGDYVFAVKVRVGDLLVPPEPERRRSEKAGRIDAVGALLLNDGYVEKDIPAANVRLVHSGELREADYNEGLHPRGRHGKWIRKPIRNVLRRITPSLKPANAPEHRAPLQERGTEQGRYVWLRGRYVFVPRHRVFHRKLDHVTFHSPAGSTNIYRNGNLVQVEGESPPPHHRDLNPPAQPDVRNVPGTAEYSPAGGEKSDGTEKWKRILDGYELGRAQILDNGGGGGGFGKAKGSRRWAVMIDGKWVANMDTVPEAKARALQALGEKSGGALVVEPMFPEVTTEQHDNALLAWAEKERGREAIFARVEIALRDMNENVQPIYVGDSMAAASEALEDAGFQSSEMYQHGKVGTITYTHHLSGAETTLSWNVGFKFVVTDVHDWKPGKRGWDTPAPPLDRPAKTWPEFADEVRGIAYRLAHEHGQEPIVGEVRLGRPDERINKEGGYDDHAGTHNTWDGTIKLGAQVEDVLKLWEPLNANEDPPLGRRRNMDTDLARSVYAGYKVAIHEAIHGGGSSIGNLYQLPEHKGIEEAITEELAHIEASKLLLAHGVTEPLAWARANPNEYKVLGTYHAYRQALDQVLNVAKVAPELREDYIRDLRWGMPPGDRIYKLASDVEKAGAMRDAYPWVKDLFTRAGDGAAEGFHPILRADLREFPSADGVILGDKRVTVGSVVKIDWGERVEKRDKSGKLRSRWRKTQKDVVVEKVGQPGTPGFKFKLDVRDLETGQVYHNIVDTQVASVESHVNRDENQRTGMPFVTVDGRSAFDQVGATITKGARVRVADGVYDGEEGVVTGMTGHPYNPLLDIQIDGESFNSHNFADQVVVLQPGVTLTKITVGDTITYDGRADGGRSEAVVTAVHTRNDSYGEDLGYALEAITTKNSLKPDTMVLLTQDRMNGVELAKGQPEAHQTLATVTRLPERTAAPQPVAIAAGRPTSSERVKVRLGAKLLHELSFLEGPDTGDPLTPGSEELAAEIGRAWKASAEDTGRAQRPGTIELSTTGARYLLDALDNSMDIWGDHADPNGGSTVEQRRNAREFQRSARTIMGKVRTRLGEIDTKLDPPEGPPGPRAEAVQLTPDEFASHPHTWWHGTRFGKLQDEAKTSGQGFHIGTYEAAREALAAQSGFDHGPLDQTVEGKRALALESLTKWVGGGRVPTRDGDAYVFQYDTGQYGRYGKGSLRVRFEGDWMLADQAEVERGDPREAFTSWLEHASAKSFLGAKLDDTVIREPNDNVHRGSGKLAGAGSDAQPDKGTAMIPVWITGPMSNTPGTPHEDYAANGRMASALKRGIAKRGYFYTNVSEDEGSISAVLPSRAHVRTHEDFVREAVQRGEQVPAHVLAHYPHLARGEKSGGEQKSPEKLQYEKLDAALRAFGAHDLETLQQWRPDLYERHPASGYMVRNDKPRQSVIHNVGEPPRIQDTVPNKYRMNEEPVPGTVRPPTHLYRAVSEEDYQQALARGFLQSDQRMNLADEGTVAAFTDPTFYLPGKLASNKDGVYPARLLKIAYRDEDGWKLDTDGYVKTPLPIPMSQIVDTLRLVVHRETRITPMGNEIPYIHTEVLDSGDKSGGSGEMLLWHGTPVPDKVREQGFQFVDGVGHGGGPAIWLSDSRPHAEGYGVPVRVAAKFRKPLLVHHVGDSNWGDDFEKALQRGGVDTSKYRRTDSGTLASPSVIAREHGFDAVVRRYPDTVYGTNVPEHLRVSPGHLIVTAFDLNTLRVIGDEGGDKSGGALSFKGGEATRPPTGIKIGKDGDVRRFSRQEMVATDAGGVQVGKLDYGYDPDRNILLLGRLDVNAAHRRQGIGRELFSRVRALHPGAEVDPGVFVSPEGEAWWGAVSGEKSGGETTAKFEGDGPLPMENGLYYRLHTVGAPFGPEHASTVPPIPEDVAAQSEVMGGIATPKPGYSAFWNPLHLVQYAERMGWADRNDEGAPVYVGGSKGVRVIAFRGTPVGEGSDGEPRVMPESSKVLGRMSWQRFADRVEATDAAYGYGRWDEHTWGDGPNGRITDDGYRSLAQLGEKSGGEFVSQVPNDQAVYVAEGAMERGGQDGGRFALMVGHPNHPNPAAREESARMSKLAQEISGDERLKVHISNEPVWGAGPSVIAAYDPVFNVVSIRPDASKLSFLHEIAHAMTKTEHGIGGHPPEFIRTVHRLYAEHISPEAAQTFWNLVGDRATFWPHPIPADPPKLKRVGSGVYDSTDGRVTMYRIEGVYPPAWNVEWTIPYQNAVLDALAGGYQPGDAVSTNLVDGAATMKDAVALFERGWPQTRAHIEQFESRTVQESAADALLESLGVPESDRESVSALLLAIPTNARAAFVADWLQETGERRSLATILG
jgi:2'-5' RNA ligase